jgi:hypothetical protein
LALAMAALLLAGLFALPHAARAADDPAAFAAARQSFWRAVASAYSVDGGAVDVEPKSPAGAGAELAALATGDMRAFRAVIGGSGEVVQGYASLAGRPPAFARFRHIGSAGLASLIEAMDLLGRPALALPDIVARIAWAYPDFGLPLELPSSPWTLERTERGMSLTWFTRTGSSSGALSFWRVVMHVDRHHTGEVTRTSMPNPFLLRGVVTR